MSTRALLPLLLLLALAPAALAGDGGRLDVYAFGQDGRPVRGLTVTAAGARGETGDDGVLRLALPVGQHLTTLLAPGRPPKQVTLPVVQGQVTELLARLRPDGAIELAVEAPAWPEAHAGPPPDEAPLGVLAGRVTDQETGAAVPGATVLVRGFRGEARTDAVGAFEVSLPAGTYAVSVIHTRFATATLTDVAVPPGGKLSLAVTLAPSSVELEVHRVSGYRLESGLASLFQERREDRAVTEVLGADQIGKSGDGDAAEALRRVTGLTVVGGRYVYIRGMGERYSMALLNGSTLPSPDPERRAVPLDLFPADVLESLSVQKTYSPDLPGEFGGGVTRIRTKGIPDELEGSLSVSGAYRDTTTGEEGLTYHGGQRDWLGVDDGTRDLPFGVEIAADSQPLILEDPGSGQGYPLEVLTSLGQTMPNIWSTQKKTVPPDLGISATFGNRHDLGWGGVLGYGLGLSYDNSYKLKEGVRRVFGVGSGGTLEPIVDYRFESLENTIETSALATLGWRPAKGHEVLSTTLWARTTEDDTEVYQGDLAIEGTQLRVTSLNWVEEQLLTQQLRGTHELTEAEEPIELSWSYAYSLATRDQPDYRRTRYDYDPVLDRYGLSNRPEGNQRLYNELQDDNHDLSLGLDLPFRVWRKLWAHLQGGGGYVYRDRESETRRFKFIHRGPVSRDPFVLAQPAEAVFARENISPQGFSFEEITRATDQYEARQTIIAGYLNLVVPLHERFEAAVGARLERSRQEVETFDLFSRGQQQANADLDTTDLLPAVNLTFHLTERMQLRGAYSRTLSRPDFRELSTAPFDQVVGAGVFIGNPDLDRTRLDNFDLRWEWYLSTDESLSVGLFYKDIQDPIETVILGGANRTLTLENADRARNLGIELEFRKRLGMIAPVLEPLFVGGNFALIESEVQLKSKGVATEDHRPLAGQSPYIVNLSIGWDDPESRISATLLYNVSGERLVGVGTFGLPDIYEQPFHRLDAVVSLGLWEEWTLKLQAENLLGQKVRFEQGGRTVESYEEGRLFSASLTAKF